jgi:hypothetical protein
MSKAKYKITTIIEVHRDEHLEHIKEIVYDIKSGKTQVEMNKEEGLTIKTTVEKI